MNCSSGMPKGKFLKESPKRIQRKRLPLVGVLSCIAIILAALLAVTLLGLRNRSVFQTISSRGYRGTQEQWIASLVGEEANPSDTAETAYALAVKNGYSGSQSEWFRTLTGYTTDEASISPYALVCKNGFEGSLTEWLTEIANKPEELGISDTKGKKTEYELACEYGYSGTFIEWLVSVTQDRVLKY